MIITKSKLLCYKKCPLQFNFQHNMRIEKDTFPAEVTTKGLDIHNLFNTFFDHQDFTQIPQKYKEIFHKFYEFDIVFSKINKSYYEQKPASKSDTTLKEFMTWDWVKRGSIDSVQEEKIKREHTFKALDLYGIVDRINYDGNNYTLIDYKSGFYNLSELRFELNFYKYLVDEAKILDKPIEFIGSYGYNNGTIFFERVNPRSYALMLEKVNAFRNIKFKEITYPKKEGYHCRWCEYQLACSNTNAQTNFGDFP